MAYATTSSIASKLEGTPIEAAASRAAAPERARRAVLMLIATVSCNASHANAVPRLRWDDEAWAEAAAKVDAKRDFPPIVVL
jgi:hypothetical protein